MHIFLIFLVGIIAIFCVFILYFSGSNNNSFDSKNTGKIESDEREQRKELAVSVAADFQRIGWERYDSAGYLTDDQIRRMNRAAISTQMKIMSTDPEQQCIYVHGDREEGYRIDKYGCSCPDFEERYLPCKHIYFLAFKLAGEHPDEDIEKIQRLFITMPDWKKWSYGIHKETAQFVRLRLALVDDSGISVMCYDPKYKIAKILDKKYGNKGKVYLTSSSRCGCADFQKRKYPCKHMYALAVELDGDEQKRITDQEHPPLHGIRFNLVGHFPKKSSSYVGVREEIATLSGPKEDLPYYMADAILLGENPSEKRKAMVEETTMEVFTLETVRELFSAEEKDDITV